MAQSTPPGVFGLMLCSSAQMSATVNGAGIIWIGLASAIQVIAGEAGIPAVRRCILTSRQSGFPLSRE
jgi:hypothetical protein